MIFTLRFSLPYTGRQLSLQKSKGYSSLSTPYIFNYRIMIPYFAHLSRRSAQTPLIFKLSPPKTVLFTQKKAPPRRSLFRIAFQSPVRGFSMLYSPSSLKDMPTVPKGK